MKTKEMTKTFTGEFSDKNGDHKEINYKENKDGNMVITLEEAMEKSEYIWGDIFPDERNS